MDIQHEPDISYLVDGRMVDRGLAVLSGAPGLGKSFVAIDLALSVPSGHAWLGAAVKRRGPSIYVCGEGYVGIKARVVAWKAARDIDLETRVGLWVHRAPVNFDMRDEVDQFIRAVRHLSPVLIISDPLSGAMVGDENSTKDMGAAVRGARHMIDMLGAGVLIVHHTPLSDPRRERGSIALRGAADVVMLLTRSDGGVRFTCEKARHHAPFPPVSLSLVRSGDSCIVRRTAGSGLDGRPGELLAVLQPGMTGPEWMAVSGFEHTTFYRYLTELKAGGDVRQEDGGYHLAAGASLNRTKRTTRGRA